MLAAMVVRSRTNARTTATLTATASSRSSDSSLVRREATTVRGMVDDKAALFPVCRQASATRIKSLQSGSDVVVTPLGRTIV